MKAIKMYNDKLNSKKQSKDYIESLDGDDSILNDETKPAQRLSVQKRKKATPLKPLWRDKNAQEIGEETLERFAL